VTNQPTSDHSAQLGNSGTPTTAPDLEPEDAKLITLARAARARTAAVEGAAVRDQDGRTYTATTVSVGELRLTALEVAVAMAASSGVDSLEAAAVVTEADVLAMSDVDVVRALAGTQVPVFRAGPDGSVREIER
jgi:hypothetical protein